MAEEYANSTAGYLDHYVGNVLSLAVSYHTSVEVRDALGGSYSKLCGIEHMNRAVYY